MTYARADRTGSASVTFADEATLTGEWGTAGYRPEAQRSLMERAPLTSPRSEPLHRLVDKLAGTPAVDLLDDLHQRCGLSWRRIAQLLGVSVRAVNKWREGGGISDDRERTLRELSAFCDVALDQGIGAVDAWLESEPWSGVPVSRADLYAARAAELLLRSVGGHLPREALDRWIPSWREKAALLDTRLHLQVSFDDDGDVIVSVEELPEVVAVGSSLTDARERLVAELRDYARDWVDHLHDAPNHALRRDVVEVIQRATDDDLRAHLLAG